MNAAEPVQRQLDAYNMRDLGKFIAEYAEDVRVYRPPASTPYISGKAALSAYYAENRFNRDTLRAELAGRMVAGNKVIDYERVTGIGDGVLELVVVYEVLDGRIQTVSFFNAY